MTALEVLPRLLASYTAYYDVNRRDPAPPFVAEAVFHSHEEGFFLVHSARLSEAETNEYVFFALEKVLTLSRLEELSRIAWDTGMARVKPHASHRSSDVILEILADRIEPDAMAQIPGLKFYRSYRFTLQGWSHFRLFALEVPSGAWACNHQGKHLKKIFAGLTEPKL